jgi:hypothetical protein
MSGQREEFSAIREDDRDRLGCRFGGESRRWPARCKEHRHSQLNKLSRECRQSVVVTLRPPKRNGCVLALDKSGFL